MKQSLTKLFKKTEVGKEGIKEIRTESHFAKKESRRMWHQCESVLGGETIFELHVIYHVCCFFLFTVLYISTQKRRM